MATQNSTTSVCPICPFPSLLYSPFWVIPINYTVEVLHFLVTSYFSSSYPPLSLSYLFLILGHPDPIFYIFGTSTASLPVCLLTTFTSSIRDFILRYMRTYHFIVHISDKLIPSYYLTLSYIIVNLVEFGDSFDGIFPWNITNVYR